MIMSRRVGAIHGPMPDRPYNRRALAMVQEIVQICMLPRADPKLTETTATVVHRIGSAVDLRRRESQWPTTNAFCMIGHDW